jgi:transposase
MNDKIKNIVKLRESGYTYNAIAQQIGVSTALVHEVIRRHAPHILGTRHCYAHLLKEIIEDIHSGLRLSKIAAKHNISVYFVHKLLANQHTSATYPKTIIIPRRSKHDILQAMQKRREQVLKLYRKGISRTKIAKNLQVCVETIRKDMRALGLPIPHSPCKTVRNTKIIEYRRRGMGMHDIAKRFRISKNRISQIVLKYNETASDPVPLTRGRKRKSDKWSGDTKKSKELWSKITQWHQAGLTRTQIAQKLNISYNYLSMKIVAFRKKFGNSFMSRTSATSRKDEIINLRNSGISAREIAYRLRVSLMTVYRMLRETTKS